MAATTKDQLIHVPIGKIRPAKDNPRQSVGDVGELAASIKAMGILEPLVCTNGGSTYEIVAGHRRLAGAKKAGLTEVPVIVRELTEEQRQEAMLVENLQRSDLSPVEEAHAFERLLALDGYTQRKLGERIGRSQSHISKRLALLKLPEAALAQVDSGGISLEDAIELARLADHPKRLKTALKNAGGSNLTWAIQSQLQALGREQTIERLEQEAKAKGLTVVRCKNYSTPEGYKRLSWDPNADTAFLRKHAKLDCHAVAADPYGHGKLMALCSNPESHPELQRPSGSAGGGGFAMPPRDPKFEKHVEELAGARRARVEFLAASLAKIPKDAQVAFLSREVAYQALEYGVYEAELLDVLGIDEPDLNDEDAPDAYQALLAIAADGAGVTRIATAIALIQADPGGNHYGRGWEHAAPYFDLLERLGYKPSPAEKLELAGKGPR